jgi:hypothetical protein
MTILKKITSTNSVLAKVVMAAIIAICIGYMGYMAGKFAWYISH